MHWDNFTKWHNAKQIILFNFKTFFFFKIRLWKMYCNYKKYEQIKQPDQMYMFTY